MISYAVNYVISSVNALFLLFDRLISAIGGAWAFVFTVIMFALICKFILSPLLGFHMPTGSDKVKNTKKGEKNE